jgi:hypothetical protein
MSMPRLIVKSTPMSCKFRMQPGNQYRSRHCSSHTVVGLVWRYRDHLLQPIFVLTYPYLLQQLPNALPTHVRPGPQDPLVDTLPALEDEPVVQLPNDD